MEFPNDADESEQRKLKELLTKALPIPPDAGIIIYPNQMGGQSPDKHKLLQSQTKHVVYKALQDFPKGVHEVELYERVFDPNCDDEVLCELRNFIPHYQGLFYEPETKVNYFCMTDALSHLKNPSICDIKMGLVSYSPDSSPEKIRTEESKYAWRRDLGFFITAIRIFDGKSIHFDRNHCRSLNPTSVYDHGIRLFLGPDPRRARSLARLFCTRLKQMASWFEKQHHFAFYASSLLFAYGNTDVSGLGPYDSPTTVDTDGADKSGRNGTNNTTTESIVLYLIDFTRWCKLSSQRDDNLLYGLYKLIDLFERAAIDPTSPTWSIPSNSSVLTRE